MKKLNYFILKRTALDGRKWWCVCYKSFDGSIHTESKHKLKRDAEHYKNELEKLVVGL